MAIIESNVGTITTVNIVWDLHAKSLFELVRIMMEHNITELCTEVMCIVQVI